MVGEIALFGGSFNPIHRGHLIVARALAEHLGLDRVIFLPSARPPHKPNEKLLDADQRAEMVRRGIQEEPLFSFSDYDMTRKGPSYTIDTVMYFREQFGEKVRLYWIIGADWLAELATWHRVRELVDTCRIITAARPGCGPLDWSRLQEKLTASQIESLRQGVVQTPLVDISSTMIRQHLQQGRSIRHLVPESVLAYIEHHKLYQ